MYDFPSFRKQQVVSTAECLHLEPFKIQIFLSSLGSVSPSSLSGIFGGMPKP